MSTLAEGNPVTDAEVRAARREWFRKWRATRKAAGVVTKSDYYSRHREAILAKRKASYWADPEKFRAVARDWGKRNPEVRRKRERRRRGISETEYQAASLAQGGLCAICGRGPSGPCRNPARLHADHDHKTGAFRGLLCASCNVMLGHARDSIDTLQKAVNYLSRSH